MGYFHLTMPMQPPPEFVAVASWCIRTFAYTIKPGLATVQRDFDALHFMTTNITLTLHDFVSISISLLAKFNFYSLHAMLG